jgi:VWFA-related protein
MATYLELLRSMPVCSALMTVLAVMTLSGPIASSQDPPVATFKSTVDLVRVSAIVRDQKGRFVQDLSARDFVVFDGKERRPVVDFGHDAEGISVALLFDASGSMEARLNHAHEAGNHLLSWLDPVRDEAAVFTFDTGLDEVAPFAAGLKKLPRSLSDVLPFGATSLHDAIAQTAERTSRREGRRRAVAVFTDGNDTASKLKPNEVSAIASAIDVPVYVFGIVASIDNPSAEIATSSASRSALAGPLEDLALYTGGRVFISSVPAERSMAARQMVDELRHQYLIAFESSSKPGWHPLTVQMRDKDMVVRARSGYRVGQSRPNSF